MAGLEVRSLDKLDPSSDLGRQWELLVQTNSSSGFMQSLYWSEVKRRQGLNSFHFGLFKDNELLGGAIFYASTKRNGVGILVAPEGPVLPWSDEALAVEGLRLIMDSIEVRSRELGIMAVRIEPRLAPPPLPTLREFGRAPVDLVPNETLYIDLSLSTQEILEGMRPKGRYNIALADRNGVTVTEDLSGYAVEQFHTTLTEASQRDDFALEPLSFFEHIATVLGSAGIARFLYAKHQGETLGALLLITYGSRATYLYGGISNTKRNLMGGYALQWAAMTKAKELGCKVYDFYGIDSFRSPEHRYARFSQFKSQFGGEVVRLIGAQDYFFLDNLADAFIKVVDESNAQVANQAVNDESKSSGISSSRQECFI